MILELYTVKWKQQDLNSVHNDVICTKKKKEHINFIHRKGLAGYTKKVTAFLSSGERRERETFPYMVFCTF